jgi:hypothetical protein
MGPLFMVARRFKSWMLLVCSAAFAGAALGDLASTAEAQDSVPVRAGRRLAADAFHTIPPSTEVGETVVGPIDLPYLQEAQGLEWAPPTFPDGRPFYSPASDTLLAMGKDVAFRREVWGLEFAFKPVRMIPVQIPDEAGEVQTKLVWYLLYRVRYLGDEIKPKASQDQFGNEFFTASEPSLSEDGRPFIAHFSLNVHELGGTYSSQFIPEALGPIAERERIGKPLYDSIAIQKKKIKLTTARENNEVWGVATWVGVASITDFFSVEIRGLTNAQRAEVENGEVKTSQKTLVLNFSRPGDTVNELADQIRYGVPASDDPQEQAAILRQYGLQERLDHYWIYR